MEQLSKNHYDKTKFGGNMPKDSSTDYLNLVAVAVPGAYVGKQLSHKITEALGIPCHEVHSGAELGVVAEAEKKPEHSR